MFAVCLRMFALHCLQYNYLANMPIKRMLVNKNDILTLLNKHFKCSVVLFFKMVVVTCEMPVE